MNVDGGHESHSIATSDEYALEGWEEVGTIFNSICCKDCGRMGNTVTNERWQKESGNMYLFWPYFRPKQQNYADNVNLPSQ